MIDMDTCTLQRDGSVAVVQEVLLSLVVLNDENDGPALRSGNLVVILMTSREGPNS